MNSLVIQKLPVNRKFGQLASDESIRKTAKALGVNNVKTIIAKNGKEAKEKVLELIPQGSEVMTMSSVTLDTIGLNKDINESGKYTSVRNKLYSMDRNTKSREMAKIGAAPDWTVASVHAVTEKGQLMIASSTGSQLSAEAYGGGKIVFVVGTQKIVKDVNEGLRRIYEYSYPLEDERAQKAYGMKSSVNKILIINKETTPGRITMILVKEKLGF
ncbi:MAG: LUD domain-containing protein [Candidatus Levybacteria bacterium]|nr:LUD domain-containing protein [Candidatus Levybacteria bacterium]